MKFKHFVTVLIGCARALPTQVAVEAKGPDSGIGGAAQEEPSVALASQVCDHELKQALAKTAAFLLRKQGQNHNFAGLRRTKAVAAKLPTSPSYPPGQLAGADVFGL